MVAQPEFLDNLQYIKGMSTIKYRLVKRRYLKIDCTINFENETIILKLFLLGIHEIKYLL